MNADFFCVTANYRGPRHNRKGCGGESGGNCALYCAVRSLPNAMFAPLYCSQILLLFNLLYGTFQVPVNY